MMIGLRNSLSMQRQKTWEKIALETLMAAFIGSIVAYYGLHFLLTKSLF